MSEEQRTINVKAEAKNLIFKKKNKMKLSKKGTAPSIPLP